jgi:hypothetical protein
MYRGGPHTHWGEDVSKPYTHLDKDRAAVLLVDHQPACCRWFATSGRDNRLPAMRRANPMSALQATVPDQKCQVVLERIAAGRNRPEA